MREISGVRGDLKDTKIFRTAILREEYSFRCWTDEGKARQNEVLDAPFACGLSLADITVIPAERKRKSKLPGPPPIWWAAIVGSDPEKVKAVHQYLLFRKWVPTDSD